MTRLRRLAAATFVLGAAVAAPASAQRYLPTELSWLLGLEADPVRTEDRLSRFTVGASGAFRGVGGDFGHGPSLAVDAGWAPGAAARRLLLGARVSYHSGSMSKTLKAAPTPTNPTGRGVPMSAQGWEGLALIELTARFQRGVLVPYVGLGAGVGYGSATVRVGTSPNRAESGTGFAADVAAGSEFVFGVLSFFLEARATSSWPQLASFESAPFAHLQMGGGLRLSVR